MKVSLLIIVLAATNLYETIVSAAVAPPYAYGPQYPPSYGPYNPYGYPPNTVNRNKDVLQLQEPKLRKVVTTKLSNPILEVNPKKLKQDLSTAKNLISSNIKIMDNKDTNDIIKNTVNSLKTVNSVHVTDKVPSSLEIEAAKQNMNERERLVKVIKRKYNNIKTSPELQLYLISMRTQLPLLKYAAREKARNVKAKLAGKLIKAQAKSLKVKRHIASKLNSKELSNAKNKAIIALNDLNTKLPYLKHKTMEKLNNVKVKQLPILKSKAKSKINDIKVKLPIMEQKALINLQKAKLKLPLIKYKAAEKLHSLKTPTIVRSKAKQLSLKAKLLKYNVLGSVAKANVVNEINENNIYKQRLVNALKDNQHLKSVPSLPKITFERRSLDNLWDATPKIIIPSITKKVLLNKLHDELATTIVKQLANSVMV